MMNDLKYIVNISNDGPDWLYHTNLNKILDESNLKEIGDTFFISKNGFTISKILDHSSRVTLIDDSYTIKPIII